jgi:hypothetical protein
VRPLGAQNRESILTARILMVFSASIVLTLGVLHLVSTFWGPSLTPRDPALEISMSQSSPVMTKETTMWRCWVGFNASHSLGLILFGLVFGYLALAHGQLVSLARNRYIAKDRASYAQRLTVVRDDRDSSMQMTRAGCSAKQWYGCGLRTQELDRPIARRIHYGSTIFRAICRVN